MSSTATDAFGRVVTVVSNGNGTVTCTTPDGLSVTAPTQAQALSSLGGMAPATYTPPADPLSSLILPGDMLARYTAAEQLAIETLAQTDMQLAVWLTNVGAANSIDTHAAATIAGVQRLVTLALLTQARATQILNLAVPSP